MKSAGTSTAIAPSLVATLTISSTSTSDGSAGPRSASSSSTGQSEMLSRELDSDVCEQAPVVMNHGGERSVRGQAGDRFLKQRSDDLRHDPCKPFAESRNVAPS